MKKLTLIVCLTIATITSFANTITVTSNEDSGTGTLRKALDDAIDDDTLISISQESSMLRLY